MSLTDALSAIRTAHGKGSSRYLADTYGVSMRTAQRWLAGTQAPAESRRSQVESDPSAQRASTAQRIRSASAVNVGVAAVVSKSSGKADGSRNVGLRIADGRMHRDLERAANLYESGDDERAEEAFSDAIMRSYGAGEALQMDDFPDGLGLT
jgi:hypothetical protein